MDRLRERLRTVAVVGLAAALALVPLTPAAHAARRPVDLTSSVSDTRIVKGELVWLTGSVHTRSGRAVKGAKVRVERRTAKGSWTKVTTVRTTANGTFSVRERPEKQYFYRVRVLATDSTKKVKGPQRRVRFAVEDRTLAERADQLGSRLGAPRGAATTTRVGTARVTHRNFAKKLLVEVAKPSSVRTWFVHGAIREAYLDAGGPDGRLGVPLADPRCGLIEGGCVQRFSGGAVYDNRSTTRATVVHGTGRRTEVLATGLSQVGFAEKRNNTSKYNAWTGTLGQPWCAAFQSWVAAASGNPGVVPKRARLHQLMTVLRRKHPERFGAKPKVGALVFFDNSRDGDPEPTHIGMVLEVRKSSIVTIEGNTSNPATGTGRGVYRKVRTLTHPIYYWYPEY